MTAYDIAFLSTVTVFTATAAVSDWRTRKLPNWLTLPTFLLAILFHAITGGWSGVALSLLGFATGFGILLVLWLIGGGGGGDVKLMGALGAWLGPTLTLQVFLVSAVLIVLLAGGHMAYLAMSRGMNYMRKRMGAASFSNAGGAAVGDEHWIRERQRFRIVPYAVPVALGTWGVLAVAWAMSTLPV